MKKGNSYKQNAIGLFRKKLGKVVTSAELAKIPGKDGNPISHNIRRIFELRDEDGYNIINHNDNQRTGLNLKVDEWVLLEELPDKKRIKSRGVNKRIRFDVFERDNYTCQTCGRTPQDDDPLNPGKKIRLHVGHRLAHKRSTKEKFDLTDKELDINDFITMCSVCNEGAKNKDIRVTPLIEKVKKANKQERKSIYEELKKEFT